MCILVMIINMAAIPSKLKKRFKIVNYLSPLGTNIGLLLEKYRLTGIIFIPQDSWVSADSFGKRTFEFLSVLKIRYVACSLLYISTPKEKSCPARRTLLVSVSCFQNFGSGAPIQIIFVDWKSRVPGLRLSQVRITTWYKFTINLFVKTAETKSHVRQQSIISASNYNSKMIFF